MSWWSTFFGPPTDIGQIPVAKLARKVRRQRHRRRAKRYSILRDEFEINRFLDAIRVE